LDALDLLFRAAMANPRAIITGRPAFDKSMPTSRRIGRRITAFWVAVNTLSFRIDDAMCGFRVYPVSSTLELIRKSVRGRRMDFDIEVLIKADWVEFPIVSVPVHVRYPDGNVSNFRLLGDNVLLIFMQTRMFFGMLIRLPWLLWRATVKSHEPAHWAGIAERGSYWGLHFLLFIYRLLGRRFCLAIMFPVVFYFFVTGHVQRRASRDYLRRLWRCGHLHERPSVFTSFCHFMSFGSSVLDKIAAWSGHIPVSSLDYATSEIFGEIEARGRGVVIITAHIGNPEVMRAMALHFRSIHINVLMHTNNAQLFNGLIQKIQPGAKMRVIPVTSVGPAEAMLLADAIARGEWVVIAGDRVPVLDGTRTVSVPFLGEDAPFPQGPYILGAILKAPTYLLFCVRDKARYRISLTRFADPIYLPRGDRINAIAQCATLFAKALEECVVRAPLQWFNFYPFWKTQRALTSQPEVAE